MRRCWPQDAPAGGDGNRPQRDQTKTAVLSSHFDNPEIGRDALAPYNHGGSIAVASAWLAIYLIAAIQQFMACHCRWFSGFDEQVHQCNCIGFAILRLLASISRPLIHNHLGKPRTTGERAPK